MIAPAGICVLLGISSGSEVTFDAATFMRTGGARLYGFILFHELPHRPAAQGLARLVAMVAEGGLIRKSNWRRPSIRLQRWRINFTPAVSEERRY